MFAGKMQIMRKEAETCRVSEAHTPAYFRNKILTRIIKEQHDDIKVESHCFMFSPSEPIHIRS